MIIQIDPNPAFLGVHVSGVNSFRLFLSKQSNRFELTNPQPSTTLKVLLRGQDAGLANKPMRSCSPNGGRAKPGDRSKQNKTNKCILISHHSKKTWTYHPITLPYLVFLMIHNTSLIYPQMMSYFPQKWNSHITPDSSAMKFWPDLQCIQDGTKELSNRKWHLAGREFPMSPSRGRLSVDFRQNVLIRSNWDPPAVFRKRRAPKDRCWGTSHLVTIRECSMNLDVSMTKSEDWRFIHFIIRFQILTKDFGCDRSFQFV